MVWPLDGHHIGFEQRLDRRQTLGLALAIIDRQSHVNAVGADRRSIGSVGGPKFRKANNVRLGNVRIGLAGIVGAFTAAKRLCGAARITEHTVNQLVSAKVNFDGHVRLRGWFQHNRVDTTVGPTSRGVLAYFPRFSAIS